MYGMCVWLCVRMCVVCVCERDIDRLYIIYLYIQIDFYMYIPLNSEKAFLSKNVLHDQDHIYFSWLNF